VNRNLYYTVEHILSELAIIITHNSKLPEEIYECYTELQEIADDLELMVQRSGMDCEEIANDIYNIYLDMIDLYIEYLEIQASHVDML